MLVFKEERNPMNKRILAAALASAILAPLAAHADPAGVTLYGLINADVEVDGTTDGKTATGANANNYPTRARVQSNSSNFGVRGKEDLAEGLAAIFQIEASAPVNGSTTPSNSTNTQGNQIAGSTGTIASRNSNVGLTGGFGTLFFGSWDTPYKTSTLPLDINWGNASAYYYTNILSGGTTPTVGNSVARNSFDRRQENSIQYWTPKLGGVVTAKLVYSADSLRPAQPGSTNPALYGLSVVYDDGALYGSLAYERHIDYGVSAAAFNNSATVTGTTAAVVTPAVGGTTSDYGVKLSLGYTIASSGTSLGAIAERLDYNGGLGTPGFWTVNKVVTAAQGAAANEARVNDYALTLKQAIGQHGTIRASYAWDSGLSLNTGALSNNSARAAVLGYSYNFSKRTDVYVFGEQVNNDNNSRNDLGGGSQVASGSLAGGSTVRSLGAGIRHTF
jgi:predicted porin